MDSKLMFSICIPSFNRPRELKRLLESIDSTESGNLEIVICEDKSSKREEVREVVTEFIGNTQYKVNYIENVENLGYDRNLRELITYANGEYIMFMGDDDMFIPGAFDKYAEFLRLHSEFGYVLRSYRNIYKSGATEYFRYYDGHKSFEAGIRTYINLFDKSVFISGFCIKKEYVEPFMTDQLDGSLLFQLYLLAEICIRYPSGYCDIPLTQAMTGDSVPMFGTSEKEKDLYTPGTITIENSINFVKKYFEVISYVDRNNGIKSLGIIQKNMSKYSYPILSIQRFRGRNEYRRYIKELRNVGLNKSIYFEIYNLGLLTFGKKFCDSIIRTLKKILGRRPVL